MRIGRCGLRFWVAAEGPRTESATPCHEQCYWRELSDLIGRPVYGLSNSGARGGVRRDPAILHRFLLALAHGVPITRGNHVAKTQTALDSGGSLDPVRPHAVTVAAQRRVPAVGIAVASGG